jgi:hypothetical protein
MKKNNREQYLKTWLAYLKGKNQLDPKALANFLGEKLKGALSSTTMKRYNATVIANLYENGFLAGKTGKTFSGEPLEISQEIALPVLDKCLTQNYKKVKFTEPDQPAEPVEPVTEPSAAKKPRKAGGKKIVEVVAETPPLKPAKKPAGKPVKAEPQAKKAAKPEPKKPIEAKKEKPVGRKPGSQKKKIDEKPKKAVVKTKKAPGRKPGKKPRVKAAAKVPVATRKKPGPKRTGSVGRKTDLLRMGEGAFLYSLELTRRVEEMEREIAGYQRAFEAIRGLFSREMNEIEEWLGDLMK